MNADVVENTAVPAAVKHPGGTGFRIEPVRADGDNVSNPADLSTVDNLFGGDQSGVKPFGEHEIELGRFVALQRPLDALQLFHRGDQRLIRHTVETGIQSLDNVLGLFVIDCSSEHHIGAGVPEQLLQILIDRRAELLRSLLCRLWILTVKKSNYLYARESGQRL